MIAKNSKKLALNDFLYSKYPFKFRKYSELIKKLNNINCAQINSLIGELEFRLKSRHVLTTISTVLALLISMLTLYLTCDSLILNNYFQKLIDIVPLKEKVSILKDMENTYLFQDAKNILLVVERLGICLAIIMLILIPILIYQSYHLRKSLSNLYAYKRSMLNMNEISSNN